MQNLVFDFDDSGTHDHSWINLTRPVHEVANFVLRRMRAGHWSKNFGVNEDPWPSLTVRDFQGWIIHSATGASTLAK